MGQRKSYTIKDKIKFSKKAIKFQKKGIPIIDFADLAGIPHQTLNKWVAKYKSGYFDNCDQSRKVVSRAPEVKEPEKPVLTPEGFMTVLNEINSKLDRLVKDWC